MIIHIVISLKIPALSWKHMYVHLMATTTIRSICVNCTRIHNTYMRDALSGCSSVLNSDIESISLDKLLDGTLNNSSRSPEIAKFIIREFLHHNHRSLYDSSGMKFLNGKLRIPWV